MTVFLAVLIIVFDQASKWLVCSLVNYLPFKLLNGFLFIDLIYNTGGAFGILKGERAIFISVSVIAIIYIWWLLWEDKKRSIFLFPSRIGLVMVMAGAISNLIDRVRLGYVIDFIDFRVWPVFNFADICITTGVFVIFISYVLRRK
ncbi:MAG: signal peptidase II [Candidatus Omnitrophica bacterium]|nr:signal peptidase II [Candidatus Omnitrophota bacterium]